MGAHAAHALASRAAAQALRRLSRGTRALDQRRSGGSPVKISRVPEGAVDNLSPRRRRPRFAILTIALTVAACLAALAFRTPLRSRYWAWRIEHAGDVMERAVYLGALCNAGNQGRWGTSVLVRHADPAVRQYGVLVLQHVRVPWARALLLEGLTDRDPSVQRLAALGLAMHGDNAVVPSLKWLYETGDAASANAACLAFERLGTPDAVAALDELTLAPADVARRAALIDALGEIGTVECVPALLRLLSDHRTCDVPSRADGMAQRALAGLQAEGYALAPASRPTTTTSVQTVAERAAAALARISGVNTPFSSAAPEEQRLAAEREWTEWYAGRARRP